uniref:Olfactory receptor n=1 Tax=Ursus maritimus TaxID=29073 RepID=A0A452VLS3_URSMA
MHEKLINVTLITKFVLMGFPDDQVLQRLYAAFFSLVYLVALMGNILIITLTTIDQHLQTPMYFLLKNLSLIDICYISVTVPKSVMNSLTNSHSISFVGCASQVFLVVFFAGTEFALLLVMSYDRYVAICCPLHYEAIMNRDSCVMTATSWFLGSVFGVLYSASTFSLSFCGSRKVPQFFCDVPSLLKISCSKSHVTIDISEAIGVMYALFSLLSIGFSYICIFNTVLRMPSLQGCSKAFSTCTPHLIVVTTFIVTGTIAYLKPVPDSPHLVDFLVSVFYSVLPASLNPIIYSLRNKEIKAAVRRFLWKLSHYTFYGEKQ